MISDPFKYPEQEPPEEPVDWSDYEEPLPSSADNFPIGIPPDRLFTKQQVMALLAIGEKDKWLSFEYLSMKYVRAVYVRCISDAFVSLGTN